MLKQHDFIRESRFYGRCRVFEISIGYMWRVIESRTGFSLA